MIRTKRQGTMGHMAQHLFFFLIYWHAGGCGVNYLRPLKLGGNAMIRCCTYRMGIGKAAPNRLESVRWSAPIQLSCEDIITMQNRSSRGLAHSALIPFP
ncbi:hypothetical protein EDD16DRAFT_1205842 [Pisolithus croceorrhizus]|nr:hypothetical protein EDD16DRAFT_1205842 [Pisolithus croceorrhizus]